MRFFLSLQLLCRSWKLSHGVYIFSYIISKDPMFNNSTPVPDSLHLYLLYIVELFYLVYVGLLLRTLYMLN